MEAPIPTLVSHLRSNHMQAVAIGAHDNVVCLTGVSNEIYEWRFTEEVTKNTMQRGQAASMLSPRDPHFRWLRAVLCAG